VNPGGVWGRSAYGPGGVRHEGGVSLIQALVRNVGTGRPDAKGEIQVGGPHEGERTEAGRRDGVTRSRAEGPVMGRERRGDIVWLYRGSTREGRNLVDKAKPCSMSKREVWEAYKRVKATQGAAGVDGQSMAECERDVQNNRYKLWNRLASGSYSPPPVRRVDRPKGDGRTRP
jgi:RNA-directed DNA polymerase